MALEASDALRDAREACFLNASLAKGLPKECRQPFAQFASANHVDALIVLGPGLNNSAHAAAAAAQGVAGVPARLVPGERRGRAGSAPRF